MLISKPAQIENIFYLYQILNQGKAKKQFGYYKLR